jgi:hypothetical protein
LSLTRWAWTLSLPVRRAISRSWQSGSRALPMLEVRGSAGVGGDFTLTRERIALTGSGLPEIRTDQDAWFTAAITLIVEAMQAKATASAMGRSTRKQPVACPWKAFGLKSGLKTFRLQTACVSANLPQNSTWKPQEATGIKANSEPFAVVSSDQQRSGFGFRAEGAICIRGSCRWP